MSRFIPRNPPVKVWREEVIRIRQQERNGKGAGKREGKREGKGEGEEYHEVSDQAQVTPINSDIVDFEDGEHFFHDQ